MTAFRDNRGVTTTTDSLTTPLHTHIVETIHAAGGWIGFDQFMALALYTPALGYYTNSSVKFGAMPYSVENGERVAGSDFVTAPELSPLFGYCLAAQVQEAMEQTGTAEVWEFGAGSGALALQLLTTLGDAVQRYTIVDLSGTLRARQQEKLAAFAPKVRWVDALPDRMQGVVVGNEVLDAMPVQLLARQNGVWSERGVTVNVDGAFAWQDRPTALRPPVDIDGPHDYITEIHPQGEAFIKTLAERLTQGAAFFLDYGFPESEYYHPQRSGGTVMCHQLHRADDDPLAAVGLKDITAHVNFTGIAVAGQDAGFAVLGYAPQAHFLFNCGLGPAMEASGPAQRAHAAKLVHEHEMGELFKVVGFAKIPDGTVWEAMGFAHGDRSHTL
ncbi:class I SAM-dependent methyltransferase [Variovorax sp. HJSM1_2]|uniref:class I SAM-dependent methyltransferase n=1 Tax=Variovorax sp. HJSM1_2 TaxID=3366263 RepID=UPI003BD71FDC